MGIKKLKIIVTGASGFIGRHLVQLLASKGHNVYAVYANLKPVIPKQTNLIEWIKCDLTKGFGPIEQLKNVDCIINLASVGISPRFAPLDVMVNVNILMTSLLFDYAKKQDIRRLIFAGSCHEYGFSGDKYHHIPPEAPLLPNNVYGASKAASFNMIHALSLASDVEVYYGRIFSVFGEGQHSTNLWSQIAAAANNCTDLNLSSGEQIRDFISVNKVCEILVDSAERLDLVHHNIIVENIGTGVAKTVIQFAEEEYKRLGGIKRIRVGSIKDRPNEVKSYCAKISERHQRLLQLM